MAAKLHHHKTWELMNCPVCRQDAVITSRRWGGPRKWGVNAEHEIW
jgi:hypothetical protein